jgi:hypothetical protein
MCMQLHALCKQVNTGINTRVLCMQARRKTALDFLMQHIYHRPHRHAYPVFTIPDTEFVTKTCFSQFACSLSSHVSRLHVSVSLQVRMFLSVYMCNIPQAIFFLACILTVVPIVAVSLSTMTPIATSIIKLSRCDNQTDLAHGCG